MFCVNCSDWLAKTYLWTLQVNFKSYVIVNVTLYLIVMVRDQCYPLYLSMLCFVWNQRSDHIRQQYLQVFTLFHSPMESMWRFLISMNALFRNRGSLRDEVVVYIGGARCTRGSYIFRMSIFTIFGGWLTLIDIKNHWQWRACFKNMMLLSKPFSAKINHEFSILCIIVLLSITILVMSMFSALVCLCFYLNSCSSMIDTSLVLLFF